MIIRQEKPADFQSIHHLVEEAFKTAKVSNGKEQDYVDKLRSSANYLPKLALVTQENEKLIGHLMLTKTCVTGHAELEALLLAPLSVAIEFRSRGVGKKLVETSFGLAKKLGYTAVFVVGDPAYYSRFGFVSSTNFGIRHVPEIPPQYVMAYELVDGALTGKSGTVNFT